MKVLVTGGCGFIGTHVCMRYAELGDEVVAYDNMTKYELARTGYAADGARDHNWRLLDGLGVQMVRADVRNLEELSQAAEGCDYIIHTAAQPAMTISWEDPELDFSTNVRGTFNVLRVARKLGIPAVHCSTIHVYGNRINETLEEEQTRYVRDPAEITEQDPVMEGTITPLHASKRAAELYVQTFIDTYGVKAAAFRLTGMYGPNQFGGEDHGWVANFAIRAVMGWPINIYGTGKQVRDIVYASDVVDAFRAFYERPEPGIYNIGGSSKTAISLLECIDLLAEILGKKPDVEFCESRLGDLQYFICDIGKAQQKLHWAPEVSAAAGVTKLVRWIQENRHLFRRP